MTSATDLITYIGVPLTVAGVIPLLWNMVVAIRIWLQLRASIPPRLRQFYSLIIDPAAGQVTVVARTPSLRSPGLLTTSRSEAFEELLDQENNKSYPWPWPSAIIEAARKVTLRQTRRAEPHGTTRLASAVATGILSSFGIPAELLMQSMSQADRLGNVTSGASFAITRPRLLHRPWMSVIENSKLRIRLPDDIDEDQREEVRFTVQGDMKATDFTPLMMTWAHFVWVSLALGVSAYDTSWHSSIPHTMKDGQGNDFIKLFEENDRLHARLLPSQEVNYVTHRALAWYNIAFNGGMLFPLGCGTRSQVPINSINIPSNLSVLSSPDTHQSQTIGSVVCGKEPQDCEGPLIAACYWMLYRRDLPSGWIPVSQQMLEYRQRILCYLKDLDDRELLLGKLISIVGPEQHQQDAPSPDDEKDTTGHPDCMDSPTLLDTSNTSKKPQVDPNGDKVDVLEKGDKIGTPNQQSTDIHLETTTTTHTLANQDSEVRSTNNDHGAKGTRHADFEHSKALRIHGALRSVFETSAYVQRYNVLVNIRNSLQKWSARSYIKLIRRNDPEFVNLSGRVQSLSNPLEESQNIDARQQARIGAYNLIDPKRRERFEFAIRPYIISPSACNANWVNESKEGDLLACVALALADWGACAHQQWIAGPKLSWLARESEAFSPSSMPGSRPRRNDPGTFVNEMDVKVRELVKSVRGKGLYIAPDTPMPQLMRKDSRSVYLL